MKAAWTAAVATCLLASCKAIPDLAAEQGTLPPIPGQPATMLGLETDGWPITLESGGDGTTHGVIAVQATELGWREHTPWAIMELRRTRDGSIVKSQQQDLLEQVTVFFDPPLPVLPASLAAADSLTYEATGSMRAYRMGAESQSPLVTGTWTIHLERGKDIDGPDGPVARLSSVFGADLGFSSVEGRTEWMLDLTRGPLYNQEFMRRRVFGFPSDRLHAWTRVDEHPAE